MLRVGCGGIDVGVHGRDELPYAKNLRLPSHILLTATICSTHPKPSKVPLHPLNPVLSFAYVLFGGP